MFPFILKRFRPFAAIRSQVGRDIANVTAAVLLSRDAHILVHGEGNIIDAVFAFRVVDDYSRVALVQRGEHSSIKFCFHGSGASFKAAAGS